VTLPGTVPRRRTAFARVKMVFVGADGVEGDRVGVAVHRFVGVKRETVRLTDCGVRGRTIISEKYNRHTVLLGDRRLLGCSGWHILDVPVVVYHTSGCSR
jgi:hypothetical protein